MKKILIFMFLLMVISVFVAFCSKDGASPQENEQYLNLSGPYLGQEPPGTEPRRFAPEPLLSTTEWWWHGAPVFSPDGTELFFGKYLGGNTNMTVIAHMKLKNGKWTVPEVEGFSTNGRNNCPVFSPDGDRLYFWSERNGGGIFYAQKEENGWSLPAKMNVPVPSSLTMGMQFSFTKNNDLYLEFLKNGNLQLYRSSFTNGNYETPEILGANINTAHLEFAPYIDPDEKYIIFASKRPGGYGENDLYISFKNLDGSWGEVLNMGSSINSENDDGWPFITPDGRYFFFVSKRENDVMLNPYWVDAAIIEEFK